MKLKTKIIAISLIALSFSSGIAFILIVPFNSTYIQDANFTNTEKSDGSLLTHQIYENLFTDEMSYQIQNSTSYTYLWINDGSEDRLVLIEETSNLSIQENFTIAEIYIDFYDSRISNYMDSSSTKSFLSGFDIGVRGDESYWNIMLFMTEIEEKIDGTQNYKWYDAETNDLLHLNEMDMQPASFDDYQIDWNIASSMISNKTYTNYERRDFELFYTITQYNSWYEDFKLNPETIYSTIQFSGMKIFDDANNNGIADEYYNLDYNIDFDDTYYDSKQSEVVYDLEFVDIEEITVVEVFDESNPDIIEYKLQLSNPIIEAKPAHFEEKMNYKYDEESNTSTQYALDHYDINFIYEQTAETSSLSVKHDIDSFRLESENSSVSNSLNNLSLSIDYLIESYSESSEYNIVEDFDSESIQSSLPSDGSISIRNSEEDLISMNFVGPYKWMKDNNTYQNTVSQAPYYGYDELYYDVTGYVIPEYYPEESVVYPESEEVSADEMESEDDGGNLSGDAGDHSNEAFYDYYPYQSNIYIYSMNFLNWSGYGIQMDPKFTSFLRIRRPFLLSYGPAMLILSSLGSLAGLSILAMTKTEYRDFLKNRLLFIHTGPHRLTMEQVLENENRTKIIDLIIDEPGIHYSELSRMTGLNAGNLTWHLKILELYKIIKSEILGKYVLYFPYYDTNPISKIDLKLQKSATTMEVLNIVQENPGITQNLIANQLSKNHKTVKYHLDKLFEANLIRFEKIGRKKHLFPIIEFLNDSDIVPEIDP